MEDKIKRDDTLDLIKGMGILLMVYGHAGGHYLSFIYLFHMAIFFIASGYLYKGKYSLSVRNVLHFIIRKFKGLWVPYFFFTVFFLLFNNIFIKLNIYTINPLFLEINEGKHTLANYYSIAEIIKKIILAIRFGCGIQLGGAFWFFKISFFVQILYCVIDYIIHKIQIIKIQVLLQATISAILLGGGVLLPSNK